MSLLHISSARQRKSQPGLFRSLGAADDLTAQIPLSIDDVCWPLARMATSIEHKFTLNSISFLFNDVTQSILRTNYRGTALE